MGTKMAAAFAKTFSAKIERQILRQCHKTYSLETLHWRRILTLGPRQKRHFIEQANSYHPTIKFTAEISDTEATFLDTVIYKDETFKEQSILDIKTHFKPTETFHYAHYTSCHPPSVKIGFVKGEALRLLRTNSSKCTFEENISNF